MYRTAIALAVVAASLAACGSPSGKPAAPDSALPAATVAAAPVSTDAPAATAAPATSAGTSAELAAAMIAAGLPVKEGTGAMGPSDYGMAPFLCDGTHVYLTDIPDSTDAGARVFICKDAADADRLASYYTDLAKGSALLFSYVWRNEGRGIVVQANGKMPKEDAAKFEAFVAEQ